MTRNNLPASPTKPHSPSRVWRAITALLFSVLLAPTAALADATAPATPPAATAPAPAAAPAPEQNAAAPGAPTVAPAATDPAAAEGVAPQDETGVVLEEDNTLGMAHDLSPWGMYQNADIIVKIVMIGLAIASIITWTIWIAKGFELLGAKRRLRTEIANLKKATTLKEASESAAIKGTLAHLLVHDALEEMRLSANTREKEGIKERVSFRLERLVAACGRNMSNGTGVLATIGSTAPFVGLFGTVWGIMNSFIGIAKTQTTNLAVVAPGIAEALLATALGLVAAIPAVVIYNVFARSIAGYKAQVSDASAEVLLLVSRDLDHLPTERSSQPHMVKVG
ncbi:MULTISPECIES: tonB-system energizer ExbB [Pseudomonas]|jgi:biopolymer transport protein ExbB|uniref:Biopolymer transport protein ExbB n=1 Tax=Pseudomonas shahriarae TaxID=2745512 RepID=A0ABT5N7B3_9PSED|nr:MULTISPECIES: tonB-system energizer ExbB [Pseudomonas]SUD47272.1 TonB system transport protein ExbB [Pseudomonas fluorescens]MCU0211197.1 tonB-system energizer ExbB [Pseudomonas shahriarae]MDD0983572.1 tonB-system energizer ExbB [Pseudomonas shahriarae]MDD1036034.1 tonB-system energizer ExbB [Pseudomonas shahriarae]MDD1134357.1 tonB-system energizer ExbB [Pseudomonas shahriarae]